MDIKSSDKFGVVTIFMGDYIIGGAQGDITIWDGVNLKATKSIHSKAIDTICVKGDK